jgi:hypothetical protein
MSIWLSINISESSAMTITENNQMPHAAAIFVNAKLLIEANADA